MEVIAIPLIETSIIQSEKDQTPKQHKALNGMEPIKLNQPTFIKINELSPASVGVNFHCKVNAITTVINRLNLDGTRLRISEVLVGDETGLILLSLRNDQIDLVKEGMSLIMRNAKVTMINQGHMRVAVDRWGIIQPYEAGHDFEVDFEKGENLSNVEYELVKDPPRRRGRGRGRGRGRRRGRGGNS